MGVRLRSVYYTEKGNPAVLQLWDSSYSGATTEFKCQSLQISWRGDEARERFSPLIGSEMRISMIVDTSTLETFIEDLVGAEEGRFTVSFGILDGLTPRIAWNGYITTDNVSIEDTTLELGYAVEIRAVDGIGRLKEIDYNNAGTAYTGKETFVEHALNCLNKLDFVTDLYTGTAKLLICVANWHENSWTYASTINPLSRSRVSHGAFYYRDTKGNNVYSSCYDVLEKICTAWGARMFFSGNAFWLVQVNEMNTSPNNKTIFQYQPDGTETVTAGQDLTITHDQANLGASDLIRFSGGFFQFFLPLKSVQVDYKHIASRNLLSGYSWTEGTGGTTGAEVSISDIDSNSGTARLSYTAKLRVTSEFIENIPSSFAPYFMRFQICLWHDDYTYQRTGTISGGAVNYGPETWETNAGLKVWLYDVYTPVFNSIGPNEISLNINILTIPLPDYGTVYFDFRYLDSYFQSDGTSIGGTNAIARTWELTDNYLEYIGDGTFASQADINRFRSTNNAVASKKLEIITQIGDGPNLNSPGHIEVYNDSSEWVIADDWRVGNSGTYKAHSQLLVNETIKGQLSPVKRLAQFTFQNLNSPSVMLSPHQAISYDGAYWLFQDGTFNVQTEFFSGNWFKLQAASGYTESAVEFVPKDSAAGPPTSGSSGGTGTTGGSGGTGTGGGTGTPGSIVTMYFQKFDEQVSDTLTITENGGTLPGNANAQIRVFQNGQRLDPDQYTVSGSDIEIGADTHYSGANYMVEFTIIQ